MEKYLLENFQIELAQINAYIEHIQQVNDLAELDMLDKPVFQVFKTHFLSFQTDKKVFEYKAITISLYGLLEKYIELWIQEYLKEFSRLISYEKLPESIKDRHFELSMKLINIISEGRFAKYNILKKEDILKKLNNCLQNSSPYELNTNAFTIQSGNLTHNRIKEIFRSIDIDISKELIKNNELIKLIGLSADQIQRTEDNVLFGKINELVERRNSIAHGSKIDDLLGLIELDPYINFFEKYCIAIYKILEEKNIENHTKEKYFEVPCEGVFSQKSHIGISIENYEIKIGDWVIIKTADLNSEHYYKKEIKSLGHEKKNDYSKLKVKEKTKISIGIDNEESLPITKNCSFYLEKK